MRVRVHFNLHKHKLSVQTKQAGRGWRVAQHCDMIKLTNVRFHVSESGRQRALAQKKKNAHAFVEGDIVVSPPMGDYIHASYNPYKSRKFVLDGGEEINQAAGAYIIGKNIYVANPI